jgi:hypothetical protein
MERASAGSRTLRFPYPSAGARDGTRETEKYPPRCERVRAGEDYVYNS